MIGRAIALVVCVVAVIGLYLVAQDWMQGRDEVVFYEPGTYQGTPVTPLDEAQAQELRSRVRNQSSI
ncbi:MAG: hypothetical protein WD341_08390 [Tistlia sp.]|uniref:hypothetical protein n=1 Tax=Tistlia sp. TaxID=3057121 RepID=UPI0034A19950